VSAPELRVAEAPGLLYRLGRPPDAWTLPPWEYAGPDGTFDNRYDDPLGLYRVVYASTERYGAFVETLARFRPDLAVVAELEAIASAEGDVPTIPAGLVPAEWLANRCIGVASVTTARFADVAHSDSIAHLRTALAPRLVHFGLDDFDAGDLRTRVPRALTQEISRHVYDQGFAGLRYPSRLGDDIVNWALFEPPPLQRVVTRAQSLRADDPDLQAALRTLGLALRG
jgi:RES domain